MLRLKAAVTPGGVVVGGEEGGDGFVGGGGEVGAEQEASPGWSWARRLVRMARGFAGREVADAGADVEGEDGVVGGRSMRYGSVM